MAESPESNRALPSKITLIDAIWYHKHPLRFALLPLSFLYRLITFLRRFAYQAGLIKSARLGVPVIIVGNISVGGTGKTPFVIWLIQFLQKQGFKPGVISRGYGGQANQWPQVVEVQSEAIQVGDEPVLIKRSTKVPVVVGPNRIDDAEFLLENNVCDILISDDGLQHYALDRDIEVCVIDGQRLHGNGYCLPAGPLREPISRLREVDVQICNGAVLSDAFSMTLEPSGFFNLIDQSEHSLSDFSGKTVHAIAGIGHPQRFFSLLEAHGIRVIPHAFADHALFTADDLLFTDKLPVIMTEKDAVKCSAITHPRCYFLRVEALLPETLEARLIRLLNRFKNG